MGIRIHVTCQILEKAHALRKGLRIHSVISVNYHYITVLCPFNLLIRFKCYNTVSNKFKQILKVYFTCFVNKIERQAIFFIFNTNPRFPPFLLYVRCKSGVTFIRRRFRDAFRFIKTPYFNKMACFYGVPLGSKVSMSVTR